MNPILVATLIVGGMIVLSVLATKISRKLDKKMPVQPERGIKTPSLQTVTYILVSAVCLVILFHWLIAS